MLSNINIKLEQYKNTLNSLNSRFFYLTNSHAQNITNVDNNPTNIVKELPLNHFIQQIQNNKKLKEIKAHNTLTSQNVIIKELDLTPNPYIKLGYYNRSNFENYQAITIGFSLPIYGRENLDLQNAKALRLSSSSKVIDYINRLKQDIKIEYGNLMHSYNIYNILTKENLPQISHNIELAKSSIENGGSPFNYINLLNKKLLIQEQIVTTIASFKKSQIKLKSLIGEI